MRRVSKMGREEHLDGGGAATPSRRLQGWGVASRIGVESSRIRRAHHSRIPVRPIAQVNRVLLVALACLLPLPAADWTYFRSGPVEVWTNGDDEPARRVLAHIDQVRWLLAKTLGRPEVTPLWPVRIM